MADTYLNVTGKLIKLIDLGDNTFAVAAAQKNTELSAVGFEQITVAAAATALTNPPAGVLRALIAVEVADIRWRIDGVDPTSAIGQPALADDVIVLSSAEDVVRFRAIRLGSSSATLSVTYFK